VLLSRDALSIIAVGLKIAAWNGVNNNKQWRDEHKHNMILPRLCRRRCLAARPCGRINAAATLAGAGCASPARQYAWARTSGRQRRAMRRAVRVRADVSRLPYSSELLRFALAQTSWKAHCVARICASRAAHACASRVTTHISCAPRTVSRRRRAILPAGTRRVASAACFLPMAALFHYPLFAAAARLLAGWVAGQNMKYMVTLS